MQPTAPKSTTEPYCCKQPSSRLGEVPCKRPALEPWPLCRICDSLRVLNACAVCPRAQAARRTAVFRLGLLVFERPVDNGTSALLDASKWQVHIFLRERTRVPKPPGKRGFEYANRQVSTSSRALHGMRAIHMTTHRRPLVTRQRCHASHAHTDVLQQTLHDVSRSALGNHQRCCSGLKTARHTECFAAQQHSVRLR